MASLLSRLTEIFPEGADLHTPALGERERERVLECLDSTFVSSVGPMTVEVEQRLSNFTGAPYVAVTGSGTSALHLCLHVLGVAHGDLVIVPAMTFVATANAVLYTGAECLFADIESEQLGINVEQLEQFLGTSCYQRASDGACVHQATGKIIKALVVVHLFGVPAQIEAVVDLCRRWNIELVEDAAESLGSRYKGRHTGTFAKLAALSFNGNKIVTAGGGGAVLCADAELHKRIKHLSTTAKVPSEYNFFHDQMGFNYRMPNLNAALLLGQLEQLDEFLSRKARLHQFYADRLAGLTEGRLQECPAHTVSNYWLNNFILHQTEKQQMNELLRRLNQAKIRVRPAWNLLPTLPYLKHALRTGALPTAIDFSERIISLPSSAHLALRTAGVP